MRIPVFLPLFLVAVLGGYALRIADAVSAQAPTTTSRGQPESMGPGEPEVRTIETREMEGEVLRITGSTLVMKTGDETRELIVGSGVAVERNGIGASLSDVQPGDTVTVLESQSGEVLSVNATTRAYADWTKWLIPLLLVAGIIGIVVFMAVKSAGKSHIKTIPG